MLTFPEVDDLSAEVQRLFAEFDRRRGERCAHLPGSYAPALDVIETAAAIEVHVDVAGVEADAIRVLVKQANLVIVGEKVASEPCGPAGSAFHLVERGFGRFARVVRLHGAYDAGKARARLHAGELRITVPRIEDRRGREIRVPIEDGPDPA